MRTAWIATLPTLLALTLAAPASGASFTVTSTADQTDSAAGNGECKAANNVCTLRAAIVESNALTGPDTISVPAGTYTIATNLPISTSMTITAPAGAGQTVINANGANAYVRITGAGTVAVTGFAVTGVVSNTGGAIYVQGPDVTLTGVDVRGNGTAATGTGGIYVFSGEVSILRSAITGNRAVGSSTAYGGGVRAAGGTVLIEGTTIAGNSATAKDVGSSSYGGGVYGGAGGTLTLRHVTLLNNTSSAGSAASSGGNLYAAGTTSIADSILSGGQASNGPDCAPATAPTVTGKNIYGGPGSNGCTFPAGAVAASAPQLGSLGDHGAPGQTAVPAAGSPALDAASACPAGGRDQRGAAAPSGVACDIGAAEASADLRVSVQASAPSAAPGEQVSYVVKATNEGPDIAEATSVAIAPPAGGEVLLVTPSAGSCAETSCAVGTLAVGQSATVTLTVRMSSAGTATTSATASSPIPDSTPGDATGSASTTIAAGGGGGGGGTGGEADTTAPVLTKLGVKGRLRGGRRGRLRATLSEAATVRIVVARAGGKRRRAGVVTARVAAGEVLIVLPRKLKGKRLKPGRYRLTATATDAAGNRSKAVRKVVRVRAP